MGVNERLNEQHHASGAGNADRHLRALLPDRQPAFHLRHGAQLRRKPGKLGRDLTVEEGYDVARDVGLSILATAQDALGDLDRVKRVVKLLGMVNSMPDFAEQPKVINGCSDLMVEVFGEAGRHTCSAVGFAALPGNIAVEIECMMEVE